MATLVVSLRSGGSHTLEVPFDYEFPAPDQDGWLKFESAGTVVSVHKGNIDSIALTPVSFTGELR